MSDKTDVITAEMLNAFEENGIDDTPENRLVFLMGLDQAWKELVEEKPEEVAGTDFLYWRLALIGMIASARVRVTLTH